MKFIGCSSRANAHACSLWWAFVKSEWSFLWRVPFDRFGKVPRTKVTHGLWFWNWIWILSNRLLKTGKHNLHFFDAHINYKRSLRLSFDRVNGQSLIDPMTHELLTVLNGSSKCTKIKIKFTWNQTTLCVRLFFRELQTLSKYKVLTALLTGKRMVPTK